MEHHLGSEGGEPPVLLQVAVGRGLGISRPWKAAAAGSLSLGKEHHFALSSAWRARFNLHYRESCSSVVQIGIIPSSPILRSFDLCQRPKSIVDRAPIHSLPSFHPSSERASDRKEGECTTNESHPEHALSLSLLDLRSSPPGMHI